MLRGNDKRIFSTGYLKDVFGGNLEPLDGRLRGNTSEIFSAAVLNLTPKVYYKCQEASGLLVDSSGNGLDMTTVSGSPTYRVQSPLGDYAIRMSGAPYFSRSQITPYSGVTMQALCKMNTGASSYCKFWGTYNPGVNGWAAGFDGSTSKMIGLADGVAFSAVGDTALNDGIWHLLHWTRTSGGTWTFYIDGTAHGTGTTSANNPSGGITKIICDGGTDITFCHMAQFESALTSDQVATLYAASGGLIPA